METFALLFTPFLPGGYKMATFLFFIYKNASLPGHQSLNTLSEKRFLLENNRKLFQLYGWNYRSLNYANFRIIKRTQFSSCEGKDKGQWLLQNRRRSQGLCCNNELCWNSTEAWNKSIQCYSQCSVRYAGSYICQLNLNSYKRNCNQ